MANKFYSDGEAHEILESLIDAFKHYYQNSDFKSLADVDKNGKLNSSFFRRLDFDGKNSNIEIEFRISRSTLEPFFNNTEERKFNDQTDTKIQILIDFYNAHIYDPEEKHYQEVSKTKLDTNENNAKDADTNSMRESIADLSNEPQKKSKRKGRKLNRTGIVLFSIIGILFVLYLVLSEMGNRVITPIEDALETTLVGEFDPDPAKKGMGFVSIHKGDVPDDGANTFDAINLSGLKSGEEFIFTVFTDFHNMGMINIEDAKVKLFVSKQEAKNKLIINSELSASNAPSINDIVTIEGLPTHYDIELIKLKKENTHGKTDPKECTGYSYEIDLELEDAKQGVNLDVLDSKYNGWCDQGYVIAVYKIIAR